MRIPLLILLLSATTPLFATPIPLLNPGGELNTGVDRTAISNPGVLGWNGNSGQVINDRTDYGNGGWRLSFEDSETVWQLTSHLIETGAAYSVQFDASMFAGVLGGGGFVADLNLIGGTLLNGNFNEDTSTIDSRNYTETPEWYNTGTAGNNSQATRASPADTLLDGSRNAVVSSQGTRLFAIDTGHTISSGEVFRITYQWRDASTWDDATDRIGVTLFTTSDDTPTGTRSDIQTLLSDLSTANNSYQLQTSDFDPLPANTQGKRLFLFFEGVDGNGDNLGFARLDNFTLQRGSDTPATSSRNIIAEFYVEDGAQRRAIASQTYIFTNSIVGEWQHYHLAAPAGTLDADAGKALGIQFRSGDNAVGNYQSFDNVRLAYWPSNAPNGAFSDDWNALPDQVWLGPGYWANRLHDWNVENGRAQCILGGRDRRTVHRVGTTLRGNGADFQFSITTGLHLGTLAANSRSGLLIGAGPNLDWRGSLLIHDGLGRDFGLFLGLDGNGRAIIEDYSTGSLTALDIGAAPAGGFPTSARLDLQATYIASNGTYQLNLDAYDVQSNALLSSASTQLSSDRVLGSLGFLSHKGGNNAQFWFDDFSGSGPALEAQSDRHLAILGAMYTLSRGTLKLTAQLPPVDLTTTPPLSLETRIGTNAWQTIATAPIDNTDNLSSYTTEFRADNWDGSIDTDFRIGIMLQGAPYYWTGTIRREPTDKNEIVIAATTCQRISDGTVQNNGFDWSPARLWHPHTLAFTHLPKHQPDLFIANGDQIYEGQPTPEDSGTDFNRQHDYLYKWYLWVLQARDLTRIMPTLAMPDDHDIFQGNLWGEGGIATTNQSTGGYEEPATWVKLVDRTQTSHLPDPDPYHPTQPPPTIAQGIGVYFTGMVYGGVGMAIIEDRKFKTGSLNPPADLNQQFLLGDRQKDFLRAWNQDWAGQQIKCVLSQSPLGNLHTHANASYGFGLNDKDSHGWPVHRRNEAWQLLRQSRMFQIAGDQHVATVAQHGILGPADAGYSFTVPAIANFFPRCWDPVHNTGGTTPTVNPYTGDFFFDGNGTLPTGEPNLTAQDPAHVRLLAAGNPHEYYQQTRGIHPPNLHDRGAGYGIIRIDKTTRAVTFECWPLHADPEYPNTGSQFNGWPITISQTDNEGRTPSGYLPVIDTQWRKNPVVSVYEESTGELVYAMRTRGNLFRAPVYDNGINYRVEIAYGDEPVSEILNGQIAIAASGVPLLNSFIATQPSIVRGDATTLRWDVEAAATLSIDNGIGEVLDHTVDGIGYVNVSPTNTTTTYTLTLNNNQTASTTVLLFENQDTWKSTHFTLPELSNPAISGDDADPDQDGFTNRQEFQFQTDPRDPNSLPEIEGGISGDNGTLQIDFHSPFPVAGEHCGIVIESSEDLESWNELPANTYREVAREHTPASGTSRITVRLNQPNAQLSGQAFRARWSFN